MPTLYVPPDPSSVIAYPGYIPPAGTYFNVFNRVYYSLEVDNPNDSSQSVLIPSLVALKYRDPLDPAAPNQDRWMRFDPVDDPTARQVHIVTVTNTGDVDFGGDNSGANANDTLDVERVDVWANFDPNAASGYQSSGNKDQNVGYYNSMRTNAGFDNVTGEGNTDTPANFLHWATHLARWFASDGAGNITNANTFIDVQYIDVMRMQYAGRTYYNRFTMGWFGDYTSGQNPQPASIGYSPASPTPSYPSS